MRVVVDRIRVTNFPKGRWWVSWVDHYKLKLRHGYAGGVTVRLAQYDEALDYRTNRYQKRWPLIDQAKNFHDVQVGVRLLPALSIGSIFTDGFQDGYVRNVETVERTFKNDEGIIGLVSASENFTPVPPFWPDRPHSVLCATEYRLGKDMLNAWCVTLRTDNEICIVPCHEIFRTFYGTCPDFVEALVSGPWETKWLKVAVPKATKLHEDKSWQVSVQQRIPDRFQEQLGYMLFGVNGRSQSNAIFSNFCTDENKWGSRIKVKLPFDRSTFKLKMRRICLQRSTNKYLCLSILQSSYPCELDANFYETRGNDNSKGTVETETGKPKPFSGVEKRFPLSPKDINVADIASDKDADERYHRENCLVEPIKWWDPPVKIQYQKPESGQYEDDLAKPLSSPTTELGTAHPPGSLPTERYPLNVERGEALPAEMRYELIAEALDVLVASKHAAEWSVIEPANVSRLNGSRAVWLFPTHLKRSKFDDGKFCAWSYMDRSRERRRSALVLRILIGGIECIWVEMECREKEGFRSVLFRNTKQDSDIDVIDRVLAECAAAKGVVKFGSDLRRTTGLKYLETWMHKTRIVEGVLYLNEVSLLAALRKLV